MEPKIYLQSEQWVLVEKPAGVLSVPPRFEDGRRILGRELESFLGKQVFPVHRLDFEVSGLMIYALQAHAHKILNAGFEKSEIFKTYEAFTNLKAIEGPWAKKTLSLEPKEQTWESLIERGKRRSFESLRGSRALTLATCLGERKISDQDQRRVLFWRLHPKTGRPHQLRLELSQRAYPILGDKLYSSTAEFRGESEIALRAVALQFPEKIAEALGLPREYVVASF